eukprot:CAMPEP_0197195218 /NCGR_PEP_ID=MMETSP1423-20130617/30669_1 /TAXON_ID=476441 /ORGANISM="Pseudo-nitzschia heimii, Strain UNC1101" /LENGTH=106 /DNA_ID=CAMNT_0042648793 /DNA_START=101 /DNA_END=418 /DNA_ORIENTATION=+
MKLQRWIVFDQFFAIRSVEFRRFDRFLLFAFLRRKYDFEKTSHASFAALPGGFRHGISLALPTSCVMNETGGALDGATAVCECVLSLVHPLEEALSAHGFGFRQAT